MPKYIFFDLDGTLTDPKAGITKSVQYALRKYGVEVENPDDLCPFIGPPLRESFMKYYGFDQAGAENAVAAYREYFSVTGIFENVIYDGIEKMLTELKSKGKVLVLATSKPAFYAEKILRHFNIFDYFTFISGSELDGRRSKKSEVINYALDCLNIKDLSETIMVGDKEHDIIGANETGIMSVGVLYGYGSYDELKKAGAGAILNDTEELLEYLIN